MSYCRFGESDAYLIRHCGGGWCCYTCRINRGIDRNIKTRKGVLAHFLAHRKAGHKIPQHAIDRIKAEIVRKP